MADNLTEAQEQELLEAAAVMKDLLDSLDPEVSQAKMIQIAETLGALEEIIADEDPSPELCTCNDPNHPEMQKLQLKPNECEFGHALDEDSKYCLNPPQYKPLLQVEI